MGYALRLLYHAAQIKSEFHLVFSKNFFKVLATEHPEFNWENSPNINNLLQELTKVYASEKPTKAKFIANMKILPFEDIGSEAASGSALYKGMVVVPCSMKTMAAISHGITTNLIERAADVCLKEKRTLVLVPRETPYHLIHLENMTTLTKSGAVILPASPGFYHKPKTILDVYDFIVDRIFMHLNIPARTMKPWTS